MYARLMQIMMIMIIESHFDYADFFQLSLNTINARWKNKRSFYVNEFICYQFEF